MLVTDDGITRLANAVHPLKASSSIAVTESGMLIDFILSLTSRGQPVSERLAVPSGTSTATLANELHPLKALRPMSVTDDGIARLANALHLKKARFPMLVTDDGIARLTNELH